MKIPYYLGSLTKLMKNAEYFLHSIVFDNTKERNLYSVALLVTILELSESCIVLMSNSILSAVPAVFRSLLEAYVDLINMINVDYYYKIMEATYLKERTRTLGEAIKKGKSNPYLEVLSSKEDIVDIYQSSLEKLTCLKNDGYLPIKIRKKFELAKADDLYVSVYSILSDESHNNLSVLGPRHVSITSNGMYKITLHKNYSFSTIAQYLHTIPGIIYHSCDSITDVVQKYNKNSLLLLKEYSDKIREGIDKEELPISEE